MKSKFFLLLLILVIQFTQPVSGQNQSQPSQPVVRVPDRFLLAEPGTIRLEGVLGSRVGKNLQSWLVLKNEAELLGGFTQRPGKQAWVGEHVGKWIHAATLAWVYANDAALRAKVDRVVASLIATQQASGYLGTYSDGSRFGMGKDEQWDVWVHKYVLLGLITYSVHSGDARALEAARRAADLLIATFGSQGNLDLNERSTHVGMASGSVLEPMVLLYRVTGDERYLTFARFIADHWEAEKGPRLISSLTANRSVRDTANGKAYEMLSCLVGLTELYRVTGDARYLTPALNAWKDIVGHHLLITGSGSNAEHWREPDILKSSFDDKVAETCVTVSWIQLNQQLLRLTGEARFADELEKTVFNHLAAAQRPDGTAWSYFTAHDGTKPYSSEQNCCTSSGPRGWAMLPAFAYMVADDNGVVVNFFGPSVANLRLKDGTVVSIRQETGYPVDGEVKLTVTVPRPTTFSLYVRVPSWSSISHRGAPFKAQPGSYWKLRQTWSRSQTIALDVALPVRLIQGRGANGGQVALARGPQVLALDERFNQVIKPLELITIAQSIPRLSAVVNLTDSDGLPVYETEGIVTSDIEGHRAGTRIPIRFVPFASAGASGSSYRVWLSRPPVSQ